MFKDWKISSFNGALIGAYFIPTWAVPALRIVESPVRGMYERANVSPIMFVADYLDFSGLAMVRFAWLLALAKFTVAAFFAISIVFTMKDSTRHNGASEEALSLALILGGFISFASMLFAAKVGEPEALRLHATESLLLLSIGVVLLVETAPHQSLEATVDSKDLSSDVLARSTYPLSSPSS
jgi:hypothetical protein